MTRVAFILAVIFSLLLAYAESRAWVAALIGYAIVHALVRYGMEAGGLFAAEHRARRHVATPCGLGALQQQRPRVVALGRH